MDLAAHKPQTGLYPLLPLATTGGVVIALLLFPLVVPSAYVQHLGILILMYVALS